MTARKPLVIVAGQTRQLATGDSIDALSLPNPASIPREVSFPPSPAANDLLHRTDLGVICEWDGAQWVGPQQYVPIPVWSLSPPWTASQAALQLAIFGTYIVSLRLVRMVNTTNNSTSYWNIKPFRDSVFVGQTIQTYPGAANTIATVTADFGTLVISERFGITLEKIGSPGSINISAAISIRRIYN